MKKSIFIFLPSIILLTGVMAFKFAGSYKITAKARNIKAAILTKKRISFGCGPLAGYDDIPADIPPLPGWGSYSWKITTKSDSAQFYFNQGINMYYAFHMIESIASFEKASRFDSTNPMIWYGRALSLGPTINDDATIPPPVTAWECAVKSKTFAAACTPFEKDLIDAIQQRYSADTAPNISTLKQHYTDAMKVVSGKYAQNADAVTLYADALMLQHPWDLYDNNLQPKPWTPVIRATLQKALALNPRHPGANHYYIHTLEGSEHPEDALHAAETLGTLMPGVSHVTHMPSHIYIRTGNYQKGITVNDSAVAGFNNYLSLYSPVINNIGLYKLHNEHLKATCAQMAGNYAIAIQTANTLHDEIPAEYLTVPGLANYIQYVYETPVLTQVRFGKWDDVLRQPVVDTLPYVSQIIHFARGIAFSRKHQFEDAQKEIDVFKAGINNPQLNASMGPFSKAYTVCMVAENILDGVLAEERGLYPQAIVSLQKAVMAEDNIVYNEPRDWPLPARQYLGNVLLKTKAYAQAAEVFNRELAINPNNGWSLTGLQTAYKALGKTTELKKVTARLQQAFNIKDIEIAQPVF